MWSIIFRKLLAWLGQKKSTGGRVAYVLALVLVVAITLTYVLAKMNRHGPPPEKIERWLTVGKPTAPEPEEPRSRIRKAPTEPEPEPVADPEQSDRWRNLPPLPGGPRE